MERSGSRRTRRPSAWRPSLPAPRPPGQPACRARPCVRRGHRVRGGGKDLVGHGEPRPRPRHVKDGEVHVRELESRLHGIPRQGACQLGPERARDRQLPPGAFEISELGFAPRRNCEGKRATRVALEPVLIHEGAGIVGERARPCLIPAGGRGSERSERATILDGATPMLSASSAASAIAASAASSSPRSRCAAPRRTSAAGRQPLAGPSSRRASSASACICGTPPAQCIARTTASHGSIDALPSGSGSLNVTRWQAPATAPKATAGRQGRAPRP